MIITVEVGRGIQVRKILTSETLRMPLHSIMLVVVYFIRTGQQLSA